MNALLDANCAVESAHPEITQLECLSEKLRLRVKTLSILINVLAPLWIALGIVAAVVLAPVSLCFLYCRGDLSFLYIWQGFFLILSALLRAYSVLYKKLLVNQNVSVAHLEKLADAPWSAELKNFILSVIDVSDTSVIQTFNWGYRLDQIMTIQQAKDMKLVPNDTEGNDMDEITIRIHFFHGVATHFDEVQCLENLSGGVPDNLQKFDKEFRLNQSHKEDSKKIYHCMAGHSMGGFLASSIALKYDLPFITFDGLGVGEGVLKNFVGEKDYQNSDLCRINIYTKDDYVADASKSIIFRFHPGKLFCIPAMSSDKNANLHAGYRGEIYKFWGMSSSDSGPE
ncbi:MAG: hypothetical protein LBI69_00230 [Puniceicoccales bacterium]|jgi:hypothetical protein|nr:hypothetical protein [Puniceicoccales bacterium]